MNLLWSVIGAIFFGFLAGATGTFFIWIVWGKLLDKVIKKKIPADQLIDEIEHTKPIIDERGQEEDERRRTEKIRQFEKLRRLGISEPAPSTGKGFYTGIFREPERGNLSNKDVKKSSGNDSNSGAAKPDSRNTVHFD